MADRCGSLGRAGLGHLISAVGPWTHCRWRSLEHVPDWFLIRRHLFTLGGRETGLAVLVPGLWMVGDLGSGLYTFSAGY